MAYHEAFWVVTGTSAPILALGQFANLSQRVQRTAEANAGQVRRANLQLRSVSGPQVSPRVAGVLAVLASAPWMALLGVTFGAALVSLSSERDALPRTFACVAVLLPMANSTLVWASVVYRRNVNAALAAARPSPHPRPSRLDITKT